MPTTLSIPHLSSILRPRPADGHKGTFGHALIIAGQYGMCGACVLALKACLRSGVGKVTAHIPQSNNDVVQISVPEAIVHHDADAERFTEAMDVGAYDSVAIGPGIGTDESTIKALRQQLIKAFCVPSVLDADALNAISIDSSLLSVLPASTILTPHPAEYRRIAGEEAPQLFAQRHRVVLVLKGHPTHIYAPDGAEYTCPWGNNGMGTAGSGDVLTGIIVGLLAQGYASLEAALLGVSLHALAGDAAAYELGEPSLVASDIIRFLPAAFKQVCCGHTS